MTSVDPSLGRRQGHYTKSFQELKIYYQTWGTAVPLHAIKAYMVDKGVTPLTLNCGNRWRGQLHAPAALLQGKASCTN